MIGQMLEVSAVIFLLIVLIRILVLVRRYSSPEDVMYLLGESLSLKSGAGISKRED